MIIDSLKASLPSNPATVQENEVGEEKNPIVFDIALALHKTWMRNSPCSLTDQ